MKPTNAEPGNKGTFWDKLPPQLLTPEGDTIPIPRCIAYHFAKTGKLFRVDVREMNFISSYAARKDEPEEVAVRDPEEEHTYLSLPFCAISRKVFSVLFDVSESTITRWAQKGMPVLEDGFMPYSAARNWVRRYREQTMEHRREGRMDGISWDERDEANERREVPSQ